MNKKKRSNSIRRKTEGAKEEIQIERDKILSIESEDVPQFRAHARWAHKEFYDYQDKRIGG